MEEQNKDFEYYAFISYNKADFRWGRRLQRKLESCRMPSTLCSERGWNQNPIRPVFFAPYDIQPGVLPEELRHRLDVSRNLIVICSPNSAKSDWVGREIEYFYRIGRGDNIYLFIVDGIPNSGDPATECMHPIFKKLDMPEKLGVNIHEKISRYAWVNRERAYVQLVTKLLGVEFDSIWQRHKRMLAEKIAAWVVGAVAVIAAVIGVWIYNQPFDATVRLREMSAANTELPQLRNAIVTVKFGNEEKTDTIDDLNGIGHFANIPKKLMGKEVAVKFRAYDYCPLDTVMVLHEDMEIPVRRDSSVYGNVDFQLWNSHSGSLVGNYQLNVGGFPATSDSSGRVRMYVPLPEQRKYYLLTSPDGLRDTLFMPCVDGHTILVD